MKFQFTARTMMLATGFLAIVMAGYGLAWQRFARHEATRDATWLLKLTFWGVAAYGPFWIPLTFVVYTLGRRALTVRMVIAFAIIEAISVPAMYLAFAILQA